jgi:archaellum component FlaC
MDIDDVMTAIKELDRKLDDFRSSYEHHAAQEARVHREIREDIRDFREAITGEVARFNAGVKGVSRDLGRVDERVGILESAI